MHIPVTVLNQLKADIFTWQIPGLRQDLVASLIRSLPKRLRRSLIPAPDYARAFLESVPAYDGNLYTLAAKEFTRICGERISADDFDFTAIDNHLLMTFVVEDLKGRELGSSKDLEALQHKMQGASQEALKQAVKSHKPMAPSDNWVYGSIERHKKTQHGSLSIVSYPALSVKGSGVTLELYDNEMRATRHMWQGLVTLLTLSIKNPTSYLQSHLPNKAKLSMYYQPLGSVGELIDDLIKASVIKIIKDNGGLVYDEEGFNVLKEKVRGSLNDTALEMCSYVEQILYKAHELKRMLRGSFGFDVALCYADVQKQLDSLVYKGFISDTDPENLKNIPRYLQSAIERVSKVSRDVNRDLNYMRKLDAIADKYYGAMTRYAKDLIPDELKAVKWMIEELRVSYFAQQLGVKGPISDKRVINEIDRILSL